MPRNVRKNKINTQLEILQMATHLFLKDGYTATYVTYIAKKLGISTGNLTFWFPSKEHLLAEFIKHLCEYHMIVMEQEVEDGKTSLLAYLLELTSMMAICEEQPIPKDIYTAAYTSPMSLGIIRRHDVEKAKMVFSEFCPDWTDEDFVLAENIVSGIEYASLQNDGAKNIPFDQRIFATLNSVMKLYNVPEGIRREKIAKVLATDYRRIGHQFMKGFTDYVERVNAKALADYIEQKNNSKKPSA